MDGRLGKLYDALETGELKGSELAPRIKTLFQKKEELLEARAEAEEVLRCQTIQLADPEIVRGYVKDLKQLLEESELVEKKAFLKSFVERIEVGESTAKVIYTIPMPPSNLTTETVGVLPFIQDGRPDTTIANPEIESLDEFYSANLGEEITRGLRESASRGFYLHSRPPFGYRKVKVRDGEKERPRLEIEPYQARIVASIFNSVIEGNGLK